MFRWVSWITFSPKELATSSNKYKHQLRKSMNQITLIALLTFAILLMATFIIIPVTKFMFNVAVIVVPFIIVTVAAYFIYQGVVKRFRR